ncbi:hypothetical protein Phep_3880 [Pedobacter heparinus DSM 2366]|uniref:Uncharacterized protein n=1 Tax=Pedobacter heparinus (strain ATCC 13125 / DSM 2366 / CIP 104194 / JCM 7457 / NBRC 12017 / NCIMB 9290 / NRRL B-14731 / HIM 762-3) TaxID=485917 RepID=C6XV63_PEDHD|nr:hypothetical protein Phep_3880 [Pedobacter heparinus DSM 2366]
MSRGFRIKRFFDTFLLKLFSNADKYNDNTTTKSKKLAIIFVTFLQLEEY